MSEDNAIPGYAGESLSVRRGRTAGPDGRPYYSVEWPDGTHTSWFPDDGRGGSELLVRRDGCEIEVGEPQRAQTGQALSVRFVPKEAESP